MTDDEQRYVAAASKDARFDGVFFVAVRTTGVYCRPSCPAITPKRENVRFYRTAAAAQRGGFRACKRCRPDASPGSPEWNVRADVAGRAMLLIADGVVDREGVAGLASRLGYSERQVGRVLTAEVGAGPLALARAQRVRTARVLVETTALPLGDVAFAAGFSSIRQFNATFLEVYDVTPTALRERARHRGGPVRGGGAAAADAEAGLGWLRLRLAYRPPIDLDRLLRFLMARAVPGIEAVTPASYQRTIILPNGPGLLRLDIVPGETWVGCSLVLTDLRDVTAAVQRARRLLDLDADPAAVAGAFAADPVLGPLAARSPGRRSPGAVDGFEMAVRAVLGQQVSVAAARRLLGRLVTVYGKPVEVTAAGMPSADGAGVADGELTHLFPDAETLAGVDPGELPMPAARAKALVGLAEAVASGGICLDPGADREETAARLLALPGIGPWTVGYIRMRALSDPDVYLPTDGGVIRALRAEQLTVPLTAAVGGDGAVTAPGEVDGRAERWRPWRSYAVHHLWAALE